MSAHSDVKKAIAVALLIFPVFAILGFALHFSALPNFFHFRWQRPPYDAGRLFDALTAGHGGHFMMAHVIVDLSLPFLVLILMVLGLSLYRSAPRLALLGVSVGMIGLLALAGVMATWLGFGAISHVAPGDYPGARSALIELSRMQGALGWNTEVSYGAFVGVMVLAAGLWLRRQFPGWAMGCLIGGCTLFLLFMDMDNWMLIGTVLMGIGLVPAVRKLWRG